MALQKAKKYASILGYNYNSSEWFEQSYKIFNKNYKIRKIETVKKMTVFLKKWLKLLDKTWQKIKIISDFKDKIKVIKKHNKHYYSDDSQLLPMHNMMI